jgi:predicted nucleic acid-binding protein
VLDTSAAVKCYAREDGSESALALLASGAAFTVPDIFPLELASGLLRKERRGDVAPGTANQALLDLGLLDFELVPHAPLLAAATALASEHRHGVYDCLFLLIARDRAVPVATFDGPMAMLARRLGVELWSPDA